MALVARRPAKLVSSAASVAKSYSSSATTRPYLAAPQVTKRDETASLKDQA